MTNKEIVKIWFASLDENNFEAIRKLTDSNYKFYNPMSPVPFGINEHVGMMQMFASAFKAIHHLDIVIGEGDYVAVKGTWNAIHTGEFNGVPATGKPVQLSSLEIFHIVDGKIIDNILEMNAMSLMAQIGVVNPT